MAPSVAVAHLFMSFLHILAVASVYVTQSPWLQAEVAMLEMENYD